MMSEKHPSRKRPPRLLSIFQYYNPPLYFVTFCTKERNQILANDKTHQAFINFARRGFEEKGIAVGRYVIMPEHIHVFVRGPIGFALSSWVRMLKRVLSESLVVGAHVSCAHSGIWQRGFFDHVIRSSESYTEKWEYIRRNPLRAGLVKEPDDWSYQGEVIPIRQG